MVGRLTEYAYLLHKMSTISILRICSWKSLIRSGDRYPGKYTDHSYSLPERVSVAKGLTLRIVNQYSLASDVSRRFSSAEILDASGAARSHCAPHVSWHLLSTSTEYTCFTRQREYIFFLPHDAAPTFYITNSAIAPRPRSKHLIPSCTSADGKWKFVPPGGKNFTCANDM